MKIFGSIIVLFSLLLLAGCVTQEETSEIKTQLTTLQDSLAQESQRITDLEFKIESISSELQSVKPPVVVEMPKMTTEEIKKIQIALTAAGFDAGKADGKIGPQTTQAIKSFQEANGLKVDGVVGKGTWEKLQGYLTTVNQVN